MERKSEIMPKLTNRPPKLGKDGNYAVVYAGGKKIRLGKFGSEEAQKNYYRFIAEWGAIGAAAQPHQKKSYLLDELALAFLSWAKDACGKSDFGNYRTAIETTLELYSGTLVEDFGPRALITVQNQFVQKGYARKYCNKLVSFIRRIFHWGVSRELVSSAVAGALKCVPSLRNGQTAAPERSPRKNVPDEVVKATLPHLIPTIADMVQVQRLAAMRPGEICNMRVGDLERSDEIWIYRPGLHKNAWREQDRIIPLGKPEQEILERRILGKNPEQYVFSPTEAMQEKWERAAAERKTKVQPSQQARKKRNAANPKRKDGESYKPSSYGKAISRTIARVNEHLEKGKQIPHWTPYQLRHTAVTELTETAGLDVARAVAGQKSLSVTQRYNHADQKIAENAAKNRSNRLE